MPGTPWHGRSPAYQRPQSCARDPVKSQAIAGRFARTAGSTSDRNEYPKDNRSQVCPFSRKPIGNERGFYSFFPGWIHINKIHSRLLRDSQGVIIFWVLVSVDSSTLNCYIETAETVFRFGAVCAERSRLKCRMMAVTQTAGSCANRPDSRTITVPASVKPLGLRQKRIKAHGFPPFSPLSPPID